MTIETIRRVEDLANVKVMLFTFHNEVLMPSLAAVWTCSAFHSVSPGFVEGLHYLGSLPTILASFHPREQHVPTVT
jgi:heptaprenylglyceryl phosphate synthase